MTSAAGCLSFIAGAYDDYLSEEIEAAPEQEDNADANAYDEDTDDEDDEDQEDGDNEGHDNHNDDDNCTD